MNKQTTKQKTPAIYGCHTSYLFMTLKTDFMLLCSFWISFVNTAERTSDCVKLSCLTWNDIRKNSRGKFTYFVIFPSFVLHPYILSSFLSGSFALLAVFSHLSSLKKFFFGQCVSAADGWNRTPQVLIPLHSPSTSHGFLSDYPVSPHW